MLRNETGKGGRHNSAVSERQGVPKGYSARKKGVQKLGSSCRYVPELQGMGISIIVVYDSKLEWGLWKVCVVVDNFVHVIYI